MKIAFFIGLYPYQLGGAEMQATLIANSLQELGHDIYFVAYSRVEYSSPQFNVKIIPTRSKLDLGYLQTRRNIFDALNEIQPDIIYHRAFVPYSYYIAQWATAHNVPFYFHIADAYTLTRSNTTIYNIVNNLLLRGTLTRASGVICQNNEQYELLKKYKLKSIKKIYNMHPVCDVNTNTLLGKKGIVWIGKFVPMKNPLAFVKLAKECMDEDMTFYMFVSKEPDKNVYKELLSEIDQLANIKLIVGKDNNYINSFLINEVRVLVNTSISEGISNTYIQAWMRGIPVLSLNSNPDDWFTTFPIGYYCKGEDYRLKLGLMELYEKSRDADYIKGLIKFGNSNFSTDTIINELCKFMRIC